MIGPPVQVAYAVADVRAAAAQWARHRGAGPFFVLDHIPLSDVRVRGRAGSFDHSSAYGQWGPLMVELICQHDAGADPVVGTNGVHHVACFVDDLDDASATLSAQGHGEILRAAAGAVTFAFHDSRATLGHHLEIYEPTESLRQFYELVRTAAEHWDGADPVRSL